MYCEDIFCCSIYKENARAETRKSGRVSARRRTLSSLQRTAVLKIYFHEIVESYSGTEVPVVNPSESRKTNSVTVFIIIVFYNKDPVENQSVVLCDIFCVFEINRNFPHGIRASLGTR